MSFEHVRKAADKSLKKTEDTVRKSKNEEKNHSSDFSRVNHSFSRVQVNQESPNKAKTSDKTAIDSCPLKLASPGFCPFGGTCHVCPKTIQTKLAISQPDDQYEREADQTATKITSQRSSSLAIDPFISLPREDTIQARNSCNNTSKPIGENREQKESSKADVLKLKTGIRRMHTESNLELPPTVQEVMNAPGAQLDDTSRAYMEPKFGYNFSNVRIHTGRKPSESANSLNALAYTVGSDIVFAEDQYKPETYSGWHLLAHELAHVIQQSDSQPKLNREEASSTPIAPRAPTADEQAIIDTARFGAHIRCQSAFERTAGIGPPPPPGRADPAEMWRRQALRYARIIFESDNPNMEQVADIVGSMRSFLTPGLQVMVAQTSDPECGNRSGYVRGLRQPIVLCPNFFNSSPEEQIRTMVHESAHLARVASSGLGESYCVIFDCTTSCGGFNSADSWSHYVHCLSGQPAEEEVVAP
jgi:hypothetical protein